MVGAIFNVGLVFVGFAGPLLLVAVLCKEVFFSGTGGFGAGRVGGNSGKPSSLIFSEGSLESKVKASKKENSPLSPPFATAAR